ncbi:hypothetical protein G7081_06310 [Vagococcus coleopterorum]|uniref:Uncharacterized protein n=1 Tax=Vagococcus coleopterorum TaxID=2714946 RepID=A0A6G8ANY8_9ENTE|nr:hypothetical protein [Vagococcus coleopterorum]QIL46716.1 hypothetical protein G7081_06310 [Vagococcus coleopterorum]
MKFLSESIRRVLYFVFFAVVLFISIKHLGQGSWVKQTVPVLMALVSLVGVLNAVNPSLFGGVFTSRSKMPSNMLVLLSLVLLMMTGDLSRLIGLAESKVATGTSVIKDKEADKLKAEAEKLAAEKAEAEAKKTKEKEAEKEIDPAILKEKAQEQLPKSLSSLKKEPSGTNYYYYSKTLENKTKKNQIFPYLITTTTEDLDLMHMNLWIRYSYVGDEQLDLKKFKIITDKEEYLMDAYDVNVDRDLPQQPLQPEDIDEDGNPIDVEMNGEDTEETEEEEQKVWEWIEFSPNSKKLDMLIDMTTSKKVKIHYEGKEGSMERDLTKAEQEALNEVVNTYRFFLTATETIEEK